MSIGEIALPDNGDDGDGDRGDDGDEEKYGSSLECARHFIRLEASNIYESMFVYLYLCICICVFAFLYLYLCDLLCR